MFFDDPLIDTVTSSELTPVESKQVSTQPVTSTWTEKSPVITLEITTSNVLPTASTTTWTERRSITTLKITTSSVLLTASTTMLTPTTKATLSSHGLIKPILTSKLVTSTVLTSSRLTTAVIDVKETSALNTATSSITEGSAPEKHTAKKRVCVFTFYYMAELVHGEKEHSDWLPERSKFCHTDR